MKRKTAYLVSKGKVEIREDKLLDLENDQVLIKVHAVGICGSDVSYYTKGSTGMGQIEYPHILGHECAGEILKTGGDVKELRPGDRVTVEPGVPCGVCEYCLRGQYNLCPSISFMSSAVKRPGGEGGMTELLIRPARFVYRIPQGVSYEQAALIEPVSVAIHAAEKSGFRPGQTAAILGCGPIAGCILQVLKSYGAGNVWMTDVVLERTELMNRIGADKAYCVKDMDQEDLIKLLPGRVDVVFDTTCNEEAINASMHWLKKGGSITLAGVPGGSMNIDLQTAFAGELSLTTTFRYANTYPLAISLIAAGKIRPELLVSHVFPLEEADKAMQMAAEKKEHVMKVMLEW